MISPNQPQTGSLMLSEPFMLDPHFKRSVVLLAEHTLNGSVGFVINQKSALLLKDIVSDCWNANFPIYIGGPVGNDTLHFIHRCYDRLISGTQILDNVYWGGDFELLKSLISKNEIATDEVKFFVGYSGWGYDQLISEMEQNSWLITNSYSHDLLFLDDEENLWKESLVNLGPRYAHIANFPENPLWN